MENSKELELILVTKEDVESGECGPHTCPWIDCGTPSN
jgi:hypothetical protein